MATDDLLDIYLAVRLLLVFGQETAKERDDGVRGRAYCDGGHGGFLTGQPGGLRGLDVDWFRDVALGGLGTGAETGAGGCGGSGDHCALSDYQKCE